MAIILPGGFQITNNEPVDSRFSVADLSARLGLSGANVYEGLTVYQQDNNQLYILNDSANPSLTTSWNIVITFPYTGSAIISGSLSLEGPFLVSMNDGNGDSNKLQVNDEGLLVFGKLDTPPTAISGGMFYSASNEFYLGFL